MALTAIKRKFSLGIDVGGTNTDGVLYDTEVHDIFASVKIPTNHADYRSCINAAVLRLLHYTPVSDIVSFNISTTLSTNALLEGKGSPVALALIGYDDFPNIKDEILETISPAALLCCKGGHNGWGFERETLDRAALRAFALKNRGAFFAVSSLYSPRNPQHEIEAAEIFKAAYASGITMSHELARSRLNAVKRTITAYLNSSLIAVTEKLIAGVEYTAASFGLSCPVMFLRSDSSLVSGSWCKRLPIETIFSGPAASMRGAMLLGNIGAEDAAIADMGGTSTDIGTVIGGKVIFSRDGASIGNYRTMIPSLEIRSIALGGDSEVKISSDGRFSVGPERVRPFAVGAGESPQISNGCTPTDALNTLCITKIGDVKASISAISALGREHGLDSTQTADKIYSQVKDKLASELDKALPLGRKICVGAPAAPFVSAKCTVPPHAEVASAVGAASSTMSLSCSINIIHRFYDERYFAFLPEKQICADNFDELLKTANDELEKYLRKQAARMGFTNVRTEINEEREYIGTIKSNATLGSVILTGHAVVQNA